VAGSESTVLGDGVVEFLRGGVAIVVATRDALLRPEIARGWGLEVSPDGSAVTLCVGLASGSPTRANLDLNGAVAITCSQPSTYRTVQLKGTVVELAEPDDARLERVREHLAAFVEEVWRVGVHREGAESLLEPDLVQATVAVRDVFDQTPGANAGARL
jgi:hypothetical protein